MVNSFCTHDSISRTVIKLPEFAQGGAGVVCPALIRMLGVYCYGFCVLTKMIRTSGPDDSRDIDDTDMKTRC